MAHSNIISTSKNCHKQRNKELYALNILTICELKPYLLFSFMSIDQI